MRARKSLESLQAALNAGTEKVVIDPALPGVLDQMAQSRPAALPVLSFEVTVVPPVGIGAAQSSGAAPPLLVALPAEPPLALPPAPPLALPPAPPLARPPVPPLPEPEPPLGLLPEPPLGLLPEPPLGPLPEPAVGLLPEPPFELLLEPPLGLLPAPPLPRCPAEPVPVEPARAGSSPVGLALQPTRMTHAGRRTEPSTVRASFIGGRTFMGR